jgi:phospholipase D1/2
MFKVQGDGSKNLASSRRSGINSSYDQARKRRERQFHWNQRILPSLVRLVSSILDRYPADVYDFSMGLRPKHDRDKVGKSRGLSGGKKFLTRLFVFFLLLLALSMAWRWTPLKEAINLETVVQWQQSLKDHPTAFFWVASAYLIGGLVLFPVTILNVATVVTFGPVTGNAYALAGWLFSAAMSFGIGRTAGSTTIQKIPRLRLNPVFHEAGRHGFVTVLSMRIVPLAPFTVINLIIGASGIGFRDFILASLVGRIPGIVTLTLFGVQLEYFLRRPGLQSLALLALAALLMLLVATWFYRHFSRYSPR